MSAPSVTTRWLMRAAFVVAAAVPLACQVIAGLEHPNATDADAAAPEPAETAPANDAAVPYACTGAVLDNTPAAAVGGTDSLLFAIAHLDTNPVSDAGSDYCATAGFDLDGKHTCQTEAGYLSPDKCLADAQVPDADGAAGAALVACAWGPSCRPSPDAVLKAQCDDPGGVDNAVGNFVAQFGKNLQVPVAVGQSLDGNELFLRGVSNLLIRIDGYNKTAEDDDVTVSFFGSSGLAATVTPEPGDAFVETDPPWRTKWDGRSLREWYVDPGTVREARPLVRSKYEYAGRVRNGVLSVAIAHIPSPFTFDGPLGDLQDGFLTAELQQLGDGSWRMVHGRIAGSIDARELLKTMLRIPFVSAVGRVRACDIEGLRSSLMASVCGSADIAGDGGDCERLSAAARFTAVPALLGAQRHVTFLFATCDVDASCR